MTVDIDPDDPTPRPLRPTPGQPCTCGKTGWPDRRDADLVVVQAKILRCLHGQQHRRETRVYRCPTPPYLFHLTSSPA